MNQTGLWSCTHQQGHRRMKLLTHWAKFELFIRRETATTKERSILFNYTGFDSGANRSSQSQLFAET